MLESNYHKSLNRMLSQLTSRVEMPPEWADFFEQKGPLSSQFSDRRRFARHHFRGKAILEIRQTLAQIQREHRFDIVYVRDLSRQGIAFVHADQLFPEEACTLWLPERAVGISVARCRRYNDRCHVVGAKLIPVPERKKDIGKKTVPS